MITINGKWSGSQNYPYDSEFPYLFFKMPKPLPQPTKMIIPNIFWRDSNVLYIFLDFRTAAPYFSNLVWFIGKHILELDACVINDTE